MHRRVCVARFVKTSLMSPLLATRGWNQFNNDVLLGKMTDQTMLWEFVVEGLLENFPQLIIQQVKADLIV